MTEKLFQKNLELWAKAAPKEAVMLPYVDHSSYSFCETDQGEINLKRTLKGKSEFYHSPRGAVKEAEKWFKQLDLKDTPVIYVYGVGLGYYYDAAKQWLKKDPKRYLVFLEDDLAVIHRLFETEQGSKILQDSRAQLIYFRDLKDEEAAFEVLYWNFVMTKIAVSALGLYAKNRKVFLGELQHKIAYDAAVKNALIDEYLRYGGAFFINFYKNMLCLPESHLGNQFFGKFTNIPAIICGAGPSLQKNIAQLKKSLGNAIIFAGGSALNALNAQGFQPHFGAGIDPNPAQYKRLSSNEGFEVPFFYRNRMFHDAFKMIHGPRLYVTGCGGYDIAEYFEEKFNIKAGFLDEGHNVVNFCVEVANAMGCNPIIFVGMDLAFTEMKAYAPGIVDDEKVTKTEILEADDYDAKALLRQDIFDKPTYTLWKWIAESEWIGEFAREHPLLKMINCTEGGIGFPGIPNKSLAEIAKVYFKRQYELANRIHGETQNSSMPQLTQRKVTLAMNALADSLKRTRNYLNILIQEAEETAHKVKKSAEPQSTQSGRAALAETELADEDGFKHVVEIFNVVQSRILNRELHEINSGRYSEKQKILKRLALNIKRLKFLSNVAQVNDELIDYAFKERKKGKKEDKPQIKIPSSNLGTYTFKNKSLTLIDPELNLEIHQEFEPVLVPKKRQNDMELADGCQLKVFYNDVWTIGECHVQKDGVLHGECLLFYPEGAKKEQTYYLKGKLHGPSIFWSEEGTILAKSWFINGKQEGKMWWYYPSGAIYSLQRFYKGAWHGRQEYYHENGGIKTIMDYHHGKLVEKPILLDKEGFFDRLGQE